MKVSDYVADFLAKQGIRHVFAISGGASLHLIHSLADTPGIDYICPQHEQAGAMAADAYARVTGHLGAAIATSGPGATNMITGVCCAYYDSVPVIYITGQVATFRLKRDSGVRQIGFQETDVVAMYKPITKYAVMIEDITRIRYELEKACFLATSGRPGPVLIDLPDNLQREQIEPEELESFVPLETENLTDKTQLTDQVDLVLKAFEQSKRPIVLLGWGIELAKAKQEARFLVEKLGVPVAPTWAVLHMFPHKHPLLVGPVGTHGTRYGNFALQNSDLVLAIGSRLDTRVAGGLKDFAREARKFVVDIDGNELGRFKEFGSDNGELIQGDALDFLRVINERIDLVRMPDISPWLMKIKKWKSRYPICLPEYEQEEMVNPYVFVKRLSEAVKESDVLFVDTGCAIAWMMQAFEFKEDQYLYHDFNNTAMGYALPASIGASIALNGEQVICVTGDGSLQMNIQELATVIRHDLPIKIFLINNHGYSMIQQTQDQWLGSCYAASNVEGGLAFPEFEKVADAYGFWTVAIERNCELSDQIHEVLDYKGPVFCNVEIRPEHRVIPQVQFGRAIEDGEPLLDRKEFFENMTVKPHEASLEQQE